MRREKIINIMKSGEIDKYRKRGTSARSKDSALSSWAQTQKLVRNISLYVREIIVEEVFEKRQTFSWEWISDCLYRILFSGDWILIAYPQLAKKTANSSVCGY